MNQDQIDHIVNNSEWM